MPGHQFRPGRPTPIKPFSIPQRSISRTVTAIGSSTSCNPFSGTSLNMYSTGKSNSSLDCLSLVWRVMNRYTSFMSGWGNPNMVSIAPKPWGMTIREEPPDVRGSTQAAEWQVPDTRI